MTAGGALMNTTEVENFPGHPDGNDCPELMGRLRAQALRFGAGIISDDVTSVELTSTVKKVTAAGTTHQSHAVVLATSSGYRKLGVSGETASRVVASRGAPPATAFSSATRT